MTGTRTINVNGPDKSHTLKIDEIPNTVSDQWFKKQASKMLNIEISRFRGSDLPNYYWFTPEFSANCRYTKLFYDLKR